MGYNGGGFHGVPKMDKRKFTDSLPERGQKVVVETLIDAYDPISEEMVLTYMFPDPEDSNTLYFLAEPASMVSHRGLVLIARDASQMYDSAGGYRGTGKAAKEFGLPQALPCKSWRPYRGYA
jgi:hypothetical protein